MSGPTVAPSARSRGAPRASHIVDAELVGVAGPGRRGIELVGSAYRLARIRSGELVVDRTSSGLSDSPSPEHLRLGGGRNDEGNGSPCLRVIVCAVPWPCLGMAVAPSRGDGAAAASVSRRGPAEDDSGKRQNGKAEEAFGHGRNPLSESKGIDRIDSSR